jgi:folate-binding protein YgfZ
VLADEYKAATSDAAIIQLSSVGIVKLSGSDRVSWLQGMITNDVAKLPVGHGCYAAHLTPQGKIVGQMCVFRDDDALWLSLERPFVAQLMAAFDKLLIMEDAQLADVSDDFSVFGLFGPKAPDVLAEWLGAPLDLDGVYSHRTIGDRRIAVSRLGYEVWVPRSAADEVVRHFTDRGVKGIGHETWDVLRTEAGIPVYGVDIDETTTMPELGENGISYDKGCYIGQEVVAKVKYIGHVNRRFVGIRMQGSEVPASKTPIRKGEKDVGYLTTSLFSPGLNQVIALGFVSRSAYAPGTDVAVGVGTGKIVELPFV